MDYGQTTDVNRFTLRRWQWWPLNSPHKVIQRNKQTDEGHLYQAIKLLNLKLINFEIDKQSIGTAYKEMIAKLAVTMEDILQSLYKSQAFEKLI